MTDLNYSQLVQQFLDSLRRAQAAGPYTPRTGGSTLPSFSGRVMPGNPGLPTGGGNVRPMMPPQLGPPGTPPPAMPPPGGPPGAPGGGLPALPDSNSLPWWIAGRVNPIMAGFGAYTSPMGERQDNTEEELARIGMRPGINPVNPSLTQTNPQSNVAPPTAAPAGPNATPVPQGAIAQALAGLNGGGTSSPPPSPAPIPSPVSLPMPRPIPVPMPRPRPHPGPLAPNNMSAQFESQYPTAFWPALQESLARTPLGPLFGLTPRYPSSPGYNPAALSRSYSPGYTQGPGLINSLLQALQGNSSVLQPQQF